MGGPLGGGGAQAKGQRMFERSVDRGGAGNDLLMILDRSFQIGNLNRDIAICASKYIAHLPVAADQSTEVLQKRKEARGCREVGERTDCYGVTIRATAATTAARCAARRPASVDPVLVWVAEVRARSVSMRSMIGAGISVVTRPSC